MIKFHCISHFSLLISSFIYSYSTNFFQHKCILLSVEMKGSIIHAYVLFSFDLFFANFRFICPKCLLLYLLLRLAVPILFFALLLLLIRLALLLILLNFTSSLLFLMLSVYCFLCIAAFLVPICTSFVAMILLNDHFLIMFSDHITLKLRSRLNALNKFFFNYYVDLAYSGD